MTPIEKRNQLLAEKMIKNLRRRNMEAFYCPTAQDAVAQVQALIADGSSVTWGGSMTIRDMGLPQALRERGTLEVLDRDLVEDAQEKQQMYLKAFSADVYQPRGCYHLGTTNGNLCHWAKQGGSDSARCYFSRS